MKVGHTDVYTTRAVTQKGCDVRATHCCGTDARATLAHTHTHKHTG